MAMSAESLMLLHDSTMEYARRWWARVRYENPDIDVEFDRVFPQPEHTDQTDWDLTPNVGRRAGTTAE